MNSQSPLQTELIFIRHGEPVLRNTFLGRTDSPLTDKGWQQLFSAFESLTDFDRLITSPLRRCHAFAAQIAEEKSRPLTVDTAFREYDFGEWDGLSFAELHDRDPELMSNYFSDPATITPPQGESLIGFSARVQQAIESLLRQHMGKRLVVLCHAGVIRTAVAWCLNLPYEKAIHIHRLGIDYGSQTKIIVHHTEGNSYPQLVGMNICG
ncbi:MAG: histidine phosphatase family protein [Hahellaceae bacterium]|nr:histidine phosphatase family protein [Hahellaceae bacterium]MCP5210884.1 histidine phosphatase family protein [Hahellaceae bacterium]